MSRLGLAVIVAVGAIILTFLLEFVVPDDPARALLPRAKGAALERVREDLHLDDSVIVQFVRYFGGVLHGDLGYSYQKKQSVASLIAERIPATALLALSAVMLYALIGITMGMVGARWRLGRRVVNSTSMVIFATPDFAIGLFFILFFGFRLHLLPVTGGFGLPQLILPALTLGITGAPWYAQLVREQTTDSLSSTYVRTAVAKGVPDRRIFRGHTLRAIAPPLIVTLGLDFAGLLSGAAIIESIFGWPGIGNLTISSSISLDRPVIMGLVIVGTFATLLFNLAADVINLYIDPRTRVETD
jgi:ABC-type dipeptide/oligopeptide/nickel transport system permease component